MFQRRSLNKNLSSMQRDQTSFQENIRAAQGKRNGFDRAAPVQEQGIWAGSGEEGREPHFRPASGERESKMGFPGFSAFISFSQQDGLLPISFGFATSAWQITTVSWRSVVGLPLPEFPPHVSWQTRRNFPAAARSPRKER